MATIQINRRSFLGIGILICFLAFVFLYRKATSQLETYKRNNVLSQRNCFIQPLANLSQLRNYMNHIEAPCLNLRQFGGKAPAPSGGKKLVCLDSKYDIRPERCTVLSFGVGDDWSFEDEMAEFGCKIVAFDPTTSQKDHQRSDKIQFYNVGISNFKGSKLLGMMRYGTKKKGKVDRYENLLEMAGLKNQIIDYMKMDVELSELDFFQDIFFNSPHLLQHVKQIAMEVHHDQEGDVDLGAASVYQLFWTYYQLLQCHGFKVIKAYNHNTRRRWTEMLWGRNIN